MKSIIKLFKKTFIKEKPDNTLPKRFILKPCFMSCNYATMGIPCGHCSHPNIHGRPINDCPILEFREQS